MIINDLRQSENYTSYMEKIGWQVEMIDGCRVFIKKLPLIGSIIKIQRPEKIPFKEIDKLAKKYRALFLKLEPRKEEGRENPGKHGFKPDNWPLLSTKTIQIDLRKPGEEILSQMKKDCRYNIRKAQESNLRIIKRNYEDFYKGWQEAVLRKHFWIPPKKHFLNLVSSFGLKAICLNNLNQASKVVAGVLILIHDKTAYYYYAWASHEGKRLAASYQLVWEALKISKKLGCQIFDFEGIEDPRYKDTKKWAGFSHFKKSFGGKEIEYPKPFIKFYNPLLKLSSNLIKFL